MMLPWINHFQKWLLKIWILSLSIHPLQYGQKNIQSNQNLSRLLNVLSICKAPTFCSKWDIKVNHIIFFWNKAHFIDVQDGIRTWKKKVSWDFWVVNWTWCQFKIVLLHVVSYSKKDQIYYAAKICSVCYAIKW